MLANNKDLNAQVNKNEKPIFSPGYEDLLIYNMKLLRKQYNAGCHRHHSLLRDLIFHEEPRLISATSLHTASYYVPIWIAFQ